MNATEARRVARAARADQEKKILADAEKRSRAAKIAAKRAARTFYTELRDRCLRSIKTAAEGGETEIELHLATFDKAYESYGDYFLEHHRHAPEVKRVLALLEKKGYTAVVESRSTCHDESVAYMNSGGECGSMTPYYTNDTVLVVKF